VHVPTSPARASPTRGASSDPAMMLEHRGEEEAGGAVVTAIERVLD
jgi:hypothetical protein